LKYKLISDILQLIHFVSATGSQTLHWLPVEQCINYKSAVLTFKTRQTSSLQYLNQHIALRTSARNTRPSSVPLLCMPFRRTSYARRWFSTATPLTWNSLPPAVLNCDSLSLLSNPDLKLICFLLLSVNYSTYLFRQRLCSRLAALWRYINFGCRLCWLESASTPLHHQSSGSFIRPRVSLGRVNPACTRN